MSAALDILHPDKPKRILMVVANAGTSPVTGWPVGFWWAEFNASLLGIYRTWL